MHGTKLQQNKIHFEIGETEGKSLPAAVDSRKSQGQNHSVLIGTQTLAQAHLQRRFIPLVKVS